MPDLGKKNPQEIALGIVHHRPTGLILIGSVGDKALSNGFGPVGKLSFPGGGIDPTDASAEDAAVREVREETGLIAKAVLYLGFRLRPDVNRIVHYIVCTPLVEVDTSRIIIPPQEGEDIKHFNWVQPFFILNTVPNLYEGVAQYLSNHPIQN